MLQIQIKPSALRVVLLMGLGLPVMAAEVAGPPVARPGIMPLAQVDRLELPTLDREEIAREDASRLEEGEPYRFAVPRAVDLSPDNAGTWEMLPDTDRLWRLRLECPGALSLNLGFDEFFLPSGAELRIYAIDGSGRALIFDEGDNRVSGQLWTPVLLNGDLVVELQLPSRVTEGWRLRLSSIGCGYRFFGEDSTAKSGACNIDVICPEGDDWRDEIATVGVYTVNGTWICSGAMVNNTSQDERPLFLTADHCNVYSDLAPTMVVYWNFESPECGEQGGGNLDDFTSGATLLATWSDTDFTLVELEESPDPAFGVNFAGWDRTGAVPSSAVTIHHPSVDEKSISFEDDPLSITSYSSGVSPGNGTHLRVADWDLGTTEGGSSGSPLFSPNHFIVGQLHGGYAACGNDLPDWYGRFSVSWEGGGTDFTRLSTWLDPEGLGNITLPLLDPEDPPIIVDPPAGGANVRINSLVPNPFRDYLEISLELYVSAFVSVKVYDLSGKVVADLWSGNLPPEESVLSWGGYAIDGARVPAGIYVLGVESEGELVRQSFVRLN